MSHDLRRSRASGRTCPTCGTDGWSDHLVRGPYTYRRCSGCGLVRLDPFPSPEDAIALYGDEYFTAAANAGYDDYVADEPVHRRNGRLRLRKVGRPNRSTVLVDVGCAHGFTLVEARERGWEPLGVDANASARAAVRARGMRCESTPEQLECADGSVGAVTFFQVLEHMTDPVGALTWAARVLEPGGRVVIETWDRSSLIARMTGRRWQVATPPSVLWLWDRPTFERLADAAGLELHSWRRSMKWVTLGLVTGQMGDRGASGRVLRLARRARSLALPYALGDLVTVTLGPTPESERPTV